MVVLRIDPISGRYRADSTGVAGTGLLAQGTLTHDPSETFITDLPRLQYVFRPTGAVFGDSVLVRGFGATVMIMMDEWSGQAVVNAR